MDRRGQSDGQAACCVAWFGFILICEKTQIQLLDHFISVCSVNTYFCSVLCVVKSQMRLSLTQEKEDMCTGYGKEKS